jgi:fatty-acyl-CoA synthase
MEFQLADLLERLCDTDPSAPILVAGDRAIDRATLDARANRLAHHLAKAGVGPGDHVGILSHNRVEWVETLVACFKLRAAAINLNYRYVTDELRYVWRDAGLRGLVYERGFAEAVRTLSPGFPGLAVYLVLDDDTTGHTEAPGEPYEPALAAASPERDFGPRSGDDRYVVYTGGTTGMPKGVVWRHEDLYLNIARPLARDVRRPEDVAGMSGNPLRMRTLTLSPLMHGGGQWPLYITVLSGGVALFPVSRRFDAAEVLGMVERHRVSTISLIGDAMGRPLAEAALAGPERFDTRSLVAISTGGALLTDPVRKLLREAFGPILITGGIGSSEIGSAARETRAFDADTGPRFALDPDVAVLDADLRPVAPGPGAVGRLARTGHIPLGYLGDPEKTAATFVTDPDGRRWVLPGDWARVEADGTITLLGRGSACINSGGEKIFPDEVEAVLARHPGVRHCAVVGVPDPTWMERVVALVEPADPAAPPDLASLQAHCRRHLAGYKVPRAVVVGPIERTPTGKVDHPRARARAIEACGGAERATGHAPPVKRTAD